MSHSCLEPELCTREWEPAITATPGSLAACMTHLPAPSFHSQPVSSRSCCFWWLLLVLGTTALQPRACILIPAAALPYAVYVAVQSLSAAGVILTEHWDVIVAV
jgi:hypothetical protein